VDRRRQVCVQGAHERLAVEVERQLAPQDVERHDPVGGLVVPDVGREQQGYAHGHADGKQQQGQPTRRRRPGAADAMDRDGHGRILRGTRRPQATGGHAPEA
jgi:hypothetical protein